jgi:hypothetical protein
LHSLEGGGLSPNILSTNVNRRHMTKGQRAMAVAKISEPPKGGRGNKLSTKGGGLSEKYFQNKLAEARTVLKCAPELADQVLSGSTSLDKAYGRTTPDILGGYSRERSTWCICL